MSTRSTFHAKPIIHDDGTVCKHPSAAAQCTGSEVPLNPMNWTESSFLIPHYLNTYFLVTHPVWVGCQVPQLSPGLIARLAHLRYHFP